MRPRTMNSLYMNKSVGYIFEIHLAKSNRLWTRTQDKFTSAGHHECVVGKMSGHRQRQHRTEHKGHTPSPSIEIKISDPPGIEPRPPVWKAHTVYE